MAPTESGFQKMPLPIVSIVRINAVGLISVRVQQQALSPFELMRLFKEMGPRMLRPAKLVHLVLIVFVVPTIATANVIITPTGQGDVFMQVYTFGPEQSGSQAPTIGIYGYGSGELTGGYPDTRWERRDRGKHADRYWVHWFVGQNRLEFYSERWRSEF